MKPTIVWAIATSYVAVWLAVAVYVTEPANKSDARDWSGKTSGELRAMSEVFGLAIGAVWPLGLVVWFIMGVADE